MLAPNRGRHLSVVAPGLPPGKRKPQFPVFDTITHMFAALNNIGAVASQNPFLAYLIIYIATIFLGNISAFASFWLVFRGFFGPWGIPLLVLTIFLADASGDLLWYSLGYTLRDTRLGNFVKKHLPHHQKMEENIHKNGTAWIFLSKFIYASSFPVIFLVGWAQINFKKFFKTSLVSIITWVPILCVLAYGLISGLTPLRAVAIFKRFEAIFVLGLAMFIFANLLIIKLLRAFFRKIWHVNDEDGPAVPEPPGNQ